MDTLRLSESAWITYSVETVGHQLYLINFQIDGADIANLNYESPEKVSAYIPTNLIEDGIHALKITTYTATNSGSIADKTGNEAYWYEFTWPVFVNKQAKENFTFNDLEFVPEGIKFSWPEYRYADFDQYEFSWSTANYQSGNINITDPRQNSYIDKTYVEGCYTNYSVYVYYTGGGFRFDNLTYYKEIKSTVIRINKDCSVDISWTHSRNEQHVQLYCIRTEAPNYGISEEHDITALNDTTLRLNEKIGFGGDYQAQLRYIPKEFNSYHTTLNTLGGLTRFALGDSIPRFQRAFPITAENSLLIYKGGTFSRYNFLTGESSETISVTPMGNVYIWAVTGSPDGKNLAVMLNDYSLGTTSLVYFSFDGVQLNELGRVHGVGEDVWAVLIYAPQAEQKLIVSRWRAMYEYNVEVRDSHTFELLYSVEIPKLFVPVVYDFTADRVIARYQYFPTEKYSYLIDIKWKR